MFDMEDTDPVRKMEELLENVVEQIAIRDIIILKKEEDYLEGNLSLIFDSRMKDVYTNDELEFFVNSVYKILGLKIELDDITSETTFDDYVEMLDEKLYNF